MAGRYNGMLLFLCINISEDWFERCFKGRCELGGIFLLRGNVKSCLLVIK